MDAISESKTTTLPSSPMTGTPRMGSALNIPTGRAPARGLSRNPTGRLSVKGELNFQIPTQRGERDHVEEVHGRESWRMKVLEFLHQKPVQIGLMVLLSLDVVLLFIELFLMTQYPACDIIERDCISCCSHSSSEADGRMRFLAEEESHDYCEKGLEADYDTGGCDPHKWETIHKVENVLFGFTVLILSTFFAELNLQMAALHPGIFFRQIFFAVDYLIVTVSLALELALHSISEESLAALIGLLIFARVWRFVRIGHGIVEVTSELIHQKHDEEIFEYIGHLEHLVKKNHLEPPKRPSVIEESLSESAEEEDA